MLGQRLRRWRNIEPTFGQFVVAEPESIWVNWRENIGPVSHAKANSSNDSLKK